MKHHQGLTYNTNSMICEGKQFNCLVWSEKFIKKMEFEISYQGHRAGGRGGWLGWGVPPWLSSKDSACQWRRCRFDP